MTHTVLWMVVSEKENRGRTATFHFAPQPNCIRLEWMNLARKWPLTPDFSVSSWCNSLHWWQINEKVDWDLFQCFFYIKYYSYVVCWRWFPILDCSSHPRWLNCLSCNFPFSICQSSWVGQVPFYFMWRFAHFLQPAGSDKVMTTSTVQLCRLLQKIKMLAIVKWHWK